MKLRRKPAADTLEPVATPVLKSTVPWSPWSAVLVAVVVYFAAQLFAALVLSLYPHVRGWDSARGEDWLTNGVTAQFFYVLLAEAITFGAIWKFIRWRGANLRAIGWRRFRWWNVMQALAGFAAYFAAYFLVLTLATHLFHSLNVNQKQDLGFSNVTGNRNLILTFISLVLLPPLVEETVFRGFVYTGIRTRVKPLVAALLTSLLFASAHLQFGSGQPLLWVAGIDTFTLSLVLCYLRQTTDSLWPGILLHGIKNTLAFVSLYLVH